MLSKIIISLIILQRFWSPCFLATLVKPTPAPNPLHKDFRRHDSIMSAKQMENYRQRAGLRSSNDSLVTKKRTTPARFSLYEECDYLARPCLHAYRTGKLCAKSYFSTFKTFKNYCMMDFVNCREGYDIWFVVYMGECITLPKITQYMHYAYHDDFFLDKLYF